MENVSYDAAAGCRLEGRHALVTGGTRGIGLAVVRAFAEAGANVTFCGRKREGLTLAMKELAVFSEQVQAVPANVSQRDDLQRLIDAADERFGAIDVLVNNAGTNPYYGKIVESNDEVWDKTLDVNLKAPYALSRMIGTGMMERGRGAIVNIASVAGLEAAPMMGIYSVSKAGLIMLTKSMAREWGRYGVRVNCVCPGVIRTQLSEKLWQEDHRAQAFLARKAMGRFGTADEVSGAVLYFASDAGSYTTGAVLQVDGGMVM